MMKNEFIPYEQALALAELGFDEPCIGWYNPQVNYKEVTTDKYWAFYLTGEWENFKPAPLKQQAFRWFREKYNLVIEDCVPFQRLYSTEDDHFEILEFGYRIYSFDQYRGGLRDKIEWDGYDNSNEEEAELACLNKLIEIIKNKV
jgi:hypothetical protein